MGFSAPSRERAGPVLPLAAMVDILFLLLIFFLTASVFRDQDLQMQVALPAASSPDERDSQRTPLIITVTDAGEIFLGSQPHTLASLGEALDQLVREYPQEAVLVRGDREGKVGALVQVIDLVYAKGLSDVRLATVRQE